MTEHPITPSPELVEQWDKGWDYKPGQQVNYADYIATQAARWGWEQRNATVEAELQQARDEELEACCEWFKKYGHLQRHNHYDLRAARRPKPPSLKERALEELKNSEMDLSPVSFEHIRRALEALPE